jgi:hypothetical protein
MTRVYSPVNCRQAMPLPSSEHFKDDGFADEAFAAGLEFADFGSGSKNYP